MTSTEQTVNQSLWNQFGASIDMLERAILMCPPSLSDNDRKFWYIAFHCLFFLDYYLTPDGSAFLPPQPFALSEFGEEMAARTYTSEELLFYLAGCREKCRMLIKALEDQTVSAQWMNASGSIHFPVIELLLYNMRHVQHHTGQLNLILRQELNDAPGWVPRTSRLL